MKEVKIKLTTFDNVKRFLKSVSACKYDIDLQSGRYAVNAKSTMGILSLDLSQPLTMVIYSDDCEKLISELNDYIVE